MLITFLDKISGFFDRRFILAFWAPMFITAGLALGLLASLLGWGRVVHWWTLLNGVEQATLGVATLLAETVLAYVLQAVAVPLVQIYEGYVFWPTWIAAWGKADQRRLRGTLEPQVRYFRFPRVEDVMPTALGNVFAAAEDYARRMYSLDTVVWWPRLTLSLPDDLRSQLDGSVMALYALINLSALLALWAISGGVLLMFTDRPWLLVGVFFGGLALSWGCYRAAVTQAGDYGNSMRVAFDLYRHRILEGMHIPVPDNLQAERVLWETLTNWVLAYRLPWFTAGPAGGPPLVFNAQNYPFYYDTHSTPQPQDTDIIVNGHPLLTIRRH